MSVETVSDYIEHFGIDYPSCIQIIDIFKSQF